MWHYTSQRKWQPISNTSGYDGFELAENHFDNLMIDKLNKTISFGNIVNGGEEVGTRNSVLSLLQIIENKTISIVWYFWGKGGEFFLFREDGEKGIRLWNYTQKRKWRPLYNTSEFDGFKKAGDTLKDVKLSVEANNSDLFISIGDANLIHSDDNLTISGIPDTTIILTPNLKLKYSFTPTVNQDSLEFSILNKPNWLEFDEATGKLEGVPVATLEYKNIIISATNVEKTVSLKPFDIKVRALENVARIYGKATQSAKGQYYQPPSNAIDGDYDTVNHTIPGAKNSWLQIELPPNTIIDSIKVYNLTGANSVRLNNARLYISNVPYDGNINTRALHSYHAGDIQEWQNYTNASLGKYILIKSETFLHLREVEIYGAVSDKPYVVSDDFDATIDKWHNAQSKILQVEMEDIKKTKITYSIEEVAPFRVDDNGNIYPTNTLSSQTYTFNIRGDNARGHILQEVNILVVNDGVVHNKFRTKDPRPSLNGYLPNTYKSGDSVKIIIDSDKSYLATIKDDTNWSIADNVLPRLNIGNHSVSLQMNTEPLIVYKNYFEVFLSRRQQQDISVTPNMISDIDIKVKSSTFTPLTKSKRVRGTSVWLKNENGDTLLINDSFRTMSSLIGTYIDSDNVKHFVRLKFDKNIGPYSNNVLEFSNSDNISIFHTATQHNMEIYFEGKGEECGFANVPGLAKIVLCTPTTILDNPYSLTSVGRKYGYDDLSEQQVYTRVFSTWNHIYNRVDGINSIDAYVNGKDYKGMTYSVPHSQSANMFAPIPDKREDFFARSFFASLSPNNATGFQVMRYYYKVPGRAGVPPFSTTGEISPDSWAAIWEGNLRLIEDGKLNTQLYEHTEHESMHTHGMTHESGLTYGWTNFAGRLFIPKYYPNGEVAIFDAPKYIFDTKVTSKNTLEIMLYKTIDATKNSLKFDILSAKPNTSEDFIFENISENKIKLTLTNTVFPRFFIRVYGKDSDEFTSKFIDQKIMLRGKVE